MRSSLYYIIEASKFHKTGKPWFSRIIFSIILLCSIISFFIPFSLENPEPGPVILNLILLAIANISGITYLNVFLTQSIKRNDDNSEEKNSAFLTVLKKLHILLPSVLIYYIGTFIGIAYLFVIPGFVFYIASIFYTCIILDKNDGIITAFKRSWAMTNGYRLRTFAYLFGYTLLLYLVASIVLSFFLWIYEQFTGSVPGIGFEYFIVFFMFSVFNLMQQRFTGLLYVDIEYNSKKTKTNPDNKENNRIL